MIAIQPHFTNSQDHRAQKSLQGVFSLCSAHSPAFDYVKVHALNQKI